MSIILFDDSIPTENVEKYGKMVEGTLQVYPPPGSRVIGYRITKHMPEKMVNINIYGKDIKYEMFSFE